MSVVRIGLSARASGISRPAAQAYWRGEHARLFARVPGLLSYVQNHAVLDDRGEPLCGDPGFDIFSEVEFADEATLEKATTGPYYRDEILPDEKKLLDASRRTFLMTRRLVLAGAPAVGMHKVALLLRSAAPLSIDSTATVVEPVPGTVAACAYVVYEVGGTFPRPVDLVLQHYFRSLDDACGWLAASRHSGSRSIPKSMSVVTAVVVTEIEVVPRAAQASFVH